MEIIGTSVKEESTSPKAVDTATVKPRGPSPKAVDTNTVKPRGPSVKPAVISAKSRRKREVGGSTESDKTTLWKKGTEKVPFFKGGKKYFTITNLYNQKVLTAVEGTPASLEIKGKPKHTNLPVKLFTDSFKSLYRHCSQFITVRRF